MPFQHLVHTDPKISGVLSLKRFQPEDLARVDLGVKVEKTALLHGVSV